MLLDTPVVLGAVAVVPMGLLATVAGHATPAVSAPVDTQASAPAPRSS